MHPKAITPEQEAKAAELAGDLTLDTRSAKEAAQQTLEAACDHYMQACEASEESLEPDTCDHLWLKLQHAKMAWKAAHGRFPNCAHLPGSNRPVWF